MSPRPGPAPGLFRGSELKSLLMLLSVAVVGLALVYSAYESQRAKQGRDAAARATPGPVADDELPPADTSLEFDFVRDRTPIGRGDTPAYAKLLEQVRSTPPEQLARAARRDVFFVQLLELPDRYRGLPIHLEGTALRILRQETPDSALFPEGRYFEAYATTPDSRINPYFLVFEAPPPGLPIGDELREPIAFDGYFLKLLAYRAGDVPRVAPLLVGRLTRLDTPPAEPETSNFRRVLPWFLGILLLLMLIRWAFYLRGLFARPADRPAARPGPIREEIEPEELSAWIDKPAEPDSDEGEGETRSDRWR